MTIGIFDSGVGGLSILRDIRRLLPSADIVYYGDTANVPYGGRPDNEIKRLSLAALERLLLYHPDLVVVACNTATSVAITDLRTAHPELPIVGVVPVLKTAVEKTKSGRVAVLATAATLSSLSYKQLKEKFANNVLVLELALPEWVTFVEQGKIIGPDVDASIQLVTQKVRNFGADVVALGCTHFPFLRPVIEKALPNCLILDSGPAVARQVVRVLTNNETLVVSDDIGTLQLVCSGEEADFQRVAQKLLAIV